MCGIAGVLGADAPETARRMIAAIAHRGPNGIRVESGPGFAFAHARLSIIDLACGWQPLHAAGAEVIGNGEIYNYLELAAEHGLAQALRTGSDFEPLLHLYGPLGDQAFEALRGMYALCLRGAQKAPVLARDPFGIKPLYVRSFGDTTLFASEPRALLAAGGTPPVVDAAKAQELLALNFTVGGQTIFQGVRRVAPGDVGPGRLQTAFLSGVQAPMAMDETRALAKLDEVLEDSVRVHQRSDVPYGLFLSGGVDSAAIATVMAGQNTRPVTAFTCGFDGAASVGVHDERRAAERIARALGLDWREIPFAEHDFWSIAPQVALALDDPTTDFAALPTYRLAQAARSTLTVVLTGEGGDELFGGYGRYRRALRPAWLGGRRAEPQVAAPYLVDGGAAARMRWRNALPTREGLTRLQSAQAADIEAWLPNDLLLKLDRCLMAHGMEGRTPFLDKAVAQFAFHLPDRLKVRRRHGKWLLRRWLERRCPAADAWSAKKGFTVPVEAWIAPRARDLGARIATIEGVREVCNADAVQILFERDHPHARRWPLLFYALWWTIHIGGATAAQAADAVIGPI